MLYLIVERAGDFRARSEGYPCSQGGGGSATLAFGSSRSPRPSSNARAAESTPLRRLRPGDRRDASEKLRNRCPRQVAGNEDQPRAPIFVRPVLELDRRVGKMLDKMGDHRPAAIRDRAETIDAEEIR